jgi:hypothetical protein
MNKPMSFLDRMGKVVKAEWNARFSDVDVPAPQDTDEANGADQRRPETATSDARPERTAVAARSMTTPVGSIKDVQAALRVLELSAGGPGEPTLDTVRAQHRRLSMHYHPKTRSPKDDEVRAAHLVLEALTEALEVLEAHLLPLPAGGADRAGTGTSAGTSPGTSRA